MKSTIIVIFLLCFNINLIGQLYAQQDPKEQIENIIKKVEESQEKLASHLAWITLSRFATSSDQLIANVNKSLESYLSADRESSWFIQEDDFLFNLFFGENKSFDEIEKATIQHLSNIKKLKYNWIQLGDDLQRSQQRTLKLFKTKQDICGMDYYLDSLNSISVIPSLDLNTKNLGQVYQFEIQAGGYTSDDGEGLPYIKVSSAYDRSKNENEAIHAATAVAGTVVSGAYGPIAGAATTFVLELAVSMVDMNKNLRQMQEIADRNHQLFESKKFEINVYKRYKEKCESLNKSYEEIYQLWQKSSEQELLDNYLDLKNNISTDKIEAWEKAISTDAESFYQYSKFIILNGLVTANTHSKNYTENWNAVIEQFDGLYSSTKNALYTLLRERYSNSQTLNLMLSEVGVILNAVENFTNFKAAFYESILDYFHTIDKVVRAKIIDLMKKQLAVYHYQFPEAAQNQEQQETLQNFENIIKKMEQENE